MPKEIERKFLVDHNLWGQVEKPQGKLVSQSYLHNKEDKTVRVRVKGEQGFLTVKGRTEGISRLEFEYEIPKKEAQEMINLLGDSTVEKTRYIIHLGKHIWEVDVFHGANKGLIVAEIELSDEDEAFQKPTWVREEVSTDHRYFNAYLVNHPFSKWEENKK